MSTRLNIKKLAKRVNISFLDENLYIQAFKHSSYVNEHQMKPYEDNERLEFLGDAVLELIVSEYLYEKHSTASEGELSKLRAIIVCEESLVQFAQHLQLDNYLLLGKGEEVTGGRQRPSILADTFEAFLGALYLDRGYKITSDFLKREIFPNINFDAFSHAMDYKSTLQEKIQKHNQENVVYTIVKECGPAHHKQFIAQVTVADYNFTGEKGQTKKEAEQRAAKRALDYFNKHNLYP